MQLVLFCYNGVFSYDTTAALLVHQYNETVALLVNQTNPVGVELFSSVNTFFCCNTFPWLLAKWVKTIILYNF